MTAVQVLADARAAGVTLTVRDGDLALSAAAPPAPELLDNLRERKAEILAILTGVACRHCGAHPRPLELGGFSPHGWRCNSCLAVTGLLALARGVIVDDELAVSQQPRLSHHSRSRPWNDDRGWIADIVCAETAEERLVVLDSWVDAAGGRLVGTKAMLPPLPHKLATLELQRMLRQAGIEVVEASETDPVAEAVA